MSSKPSQGFGHVLPQFGLVSAQGAEAAAFLQRQTMNDVRALADVGQAQWNGLLSAKGRVQSLFVLLRRAADQFWLICPDGDADALHAELRRYVLRSKLTLTHDTDWRAYGWLGATQAPGTADDALWLSWPPGRRSVLLQRATLPPPDWAVDAAIDAWRAQDIALGVPRLDQGGNDRYTPHMLSLERLAAFSLNKGCYPGQEIVARTHYLGQSKRGLARLAAASEIPADAAVRSAGQAAGQVLCTARTENGWEALAVLSEQATNELMTADGLALQRRPFDDDTSL